MSAVKMPALNRGVERAIERAIERASSGRNRPARGAVGSASPKWARALIASLLLTVALQLDAARPLTVAPDVSAGAGFAALDGFVRFDVSRAIWPGKHWRVDLYFELR